MAGLGHGRQFHFINKVHCRLMKVLEFSLSRFEFCELHQIAKAQEFLHPILLCRIESFRVVEFFQELLRGSFRSSQVKPFCQVGEVRVAG